jgi:hypothetical protein
VPELTYRPENGLGNIDKILLRGASAGKSPNELSNLTNGVVKPAEAAVRVQQILDSRDWLSDAQRKALLLDNLHDLKEVLYEKAVTFKSLDAAKPLISLLGQIDKSLAAEKFDLTKAMTEINRAHAGLMLSAISLALERSFLELEKRYPTLQKAELTEIFQTAMPDVVREIESRVPVE